MMRGIRRVTGSWVRVVEHWALRLASLICSLFSAYAIHLFFVPLSAVDRNEQVLTWGVAVAFGMLGYIVSRGLVHRMMNKERMWSYVPVCLLVVLVDMACNYILAASAVRSDWWLAVVPKDQQRVLTFVVYLILSVIPLMSIALAVVDMDLERSKGGSGAAPMTTGKPLVARANQVMTSLGGSVGASAANMTNAAAAKRAQFFANRQNQGQGQNQGQQQGGTRVLLNDPEKDMTLAGVP